MRWPTYLLLGIVLAAGPLASSNGEESRQEKSAGQTSALTDQVRKELLDARETAWRSFFQKDLDVMKRIRSRRDSINRLPGWRRRHPGSRWQSVIQSHPVSRLCRCSPLGAACGCAIRVSASLSLCVERLSGIDLTECLLARLTRRGSVVSIYFEISADRIAFNFFTPSLIWFFSNAV